VGANLASKLRLVDACLHQEAEMIVLADTSIWIDHLDKGSLLLGQLLQSDVLVMHPAVIGEISLGNIKNRRGVLSSLRRITGAVVAMDTEVLTLIEVQDLAGSGIGYIDAHLIAATLMTPHCKLWTRDKRLHTVAHRLGIAYDTMH
jgi:predicted nucleic acid-binding protein